MPMENSNENLKKR